MPSKPLLDYNSSWHCSVRHLEHTLSVLMTSEHRMQEKLPNKKCGISHKMPTAVAWLSLELFVDLLTGFMLMQACIILHEAISFPEGLKLVVQMSFRVSSDTVKSIQMEAGDSEEEAPDVFHGTTHEGYITNMIKSYVAHTSRRNVQDKKESRDEMLPSSALIQGDAQATRPCMGQGQHGAAGWF